MFDLPVISDDDWAKVLQEFRTILKNSAPLILRGGVMVVQISAKKYIVLLKSPEMAAVYAGLGALENLILYFSFESISIFPTLIKRQHTDDPLQIPKVVQNGILFVSTLSGIIASLCVMAPQLYSWANQPDDMTNACRTYFLWAMCAYIPDLFYRYLVRLIIGLDDQYTPLSFECVEMVLDIGFTFLLIQKDSSMGINGAAIAYALAAISTGALCYAYLYRLQNKETPRLFQFRLADCSWDLYQEYCKHGLRIGGTEAANYVAQTVITFLCGQLGGSALKGMYAASTISMMISLPLNGFMLASGVLVSQYYAEKRPLYHLLGTITIAVQCGYAVICLVFLTVFASSLSQLFNNSSDNALTESDAIEIAGFIKDQGWIELFNTLRATCMGVLASCLWTRHFVPINLGSILGLNVIAAFFAFSRTDAANMYATQALGYAVASMPLLFLWWKHRLPAAVEQQEEPAAIVDVVTTTPATNPHSFWQGHLRIESPRARAALDELPQANTLGG